MAGYTPKYGPPGTEPEYVGSRNRRRRPVRAASPKPSSDQQTSAQTGALKISTGSTSPKQANPPVVLATKPLRMTKRQKAWKKGHTGPLTISNQDLLPHEIADMAHEARERTEPGLRHQVMIAAAERKGAKWRKMRMNADPSFLGQRAFRLTQLYNEVREMNPTLSWEDVMTQAKDLEKQEVIAAAEGQLLEKKKARYKAKEKRKQEAAKAEKVARDQIRVNENQISSCFTREERTQVAEHGRVEQGYELPERLEQPQERLIAPIPPRRQEKKQRRRNIKVLAAHEQAQLKAAQHGEVLRAEAARREARIDGIRRDEARRHEARRAEVLRPEARGEEACRSRVRMDEAQAGRRAEAEALREEARRAEALRREKLYQAAVKSENMKRWFEQLAQDQPEPPEEMQDVAEGTELSDGMEEPEDVQDDSDAMQISG